ncbi:AMIN-like domain-containing (lipo)protein [Specibacter cremeus]|uniref:AMIN-like domain-containing (lipo)protein n=1 Tax=Specibacter cremeus TaxID=1629051 RepID=UPI000F7926B0|nr:hypothetical protein [Specibacter cremeus]
MKKLRSLLAVLILVAGFGLVAPGAASADAVCPITWGSLPKASGTTSSAPLVNVRAGWHLCFDRLVLDVKGGAPGYNVRYVSAVLAEGSGKVVPLRGGAFLSVTALVPANYPNGTPSYVPANPRELVNVTGFLTFRQVAWAGSFESHTTIGLGVRARLPFRVFTLAGPGNLSRLVIDVAHHW